jgi:hypothetical protein
MDTPNTPVDNAQQLKGVIRMAQAQTELRINFEGRTIVALPRPEDQGRLQELAGDSATITIQQSDRDTEGHLLGDEIAIDVEGHAMTLRLPNAGDAAAIRRVLAVGALTATVAVAGVFAASTVQPQTQPVPISVPRAPAAPHAAPISVNADFGLADSASQAASDEFAASHAAPITAPVTITTGGDSPDQDVNLTLRGRQGAANQAPAQPLPPQPNRDGGSHPE